MLAVGGAAGTEAPWAESPPFRRLERNKIAGIARSEKPKHSPLCDPLCDVRE